MLKIFHEKSSKSKKESDMKKTSYTVHDVIKAGCTLEPMRCLHCGSEENVTFNQGVGDAQCGNCGEWQLES